MKLTYTLLAQAVVFSTISSSILAIAFLLFWLAKDIN